MNFSIITRARKLDFSGVANAKSNNELVEDCGQAFLVLVFRKHFPLP